MERRDFIESAILGTAGIFGLSCSGKKGLQGIKKELFSFIHYSDVHIQPEKGAKEGFLTAVKKMNSLKPDFAVSGGDLVMDALAADGKKASELYNLYEECCKSFDIPHYDVMGNHEVFGITAPDKVPLNHSRMGERGCLKNVSATEQHTEVSTTKEYISFFLIQSALKNPPTAKVRTISVRLAPNKWHGLNPILQKFLLKRL